MNYKFNDNKDINRTLNQVVKQITKLSEKQMKHIQSLTRIGESLSSVTDINKIFDMILDEAIAFTKADAATIYQVSNDHKTLEFAVVYNKTLKLRMGGTYAPITWNPIPLFDDNGNPRLNHIVTNVFHKKRPLSFADVYENNQYDISGTKTIDAQNNYRSKSMLTIPLKNHEDDVLGVIQIINAMDKPGHVIPFEKEHIVMLKSLSSQAAIAMSNRKLINDLEGLLMQFMHSIATGIERKSKYSSTHITRMSHLTDMIAKKIDEEKSGKYGQVHFSANELKEISMAGLMHDVGKIITPEYIMDKATKLETIIDRIDLVDLRFELFKKAIALYVCVNGEKALFEAIKDWYPDQKPKNYDELLILLSDDKVFIDKVNMGGEFLSDASVERINRISRMSFEFKDENWILLNENEVHNLNIRKGTLTAEEKKQMDDHVLVTWEMLSQLTFPHKYKNVALYAASHHEKLNGKGHPFGLTADQLPIQSRMLSIADIFEALTSADRPYKKAKTLSESLRIMAFCVKDGDIDGDLLDFFIDSGLYLEFATEFMHPDQIDAVDLNAVKKIYHPELSN
jgi:HD-GYP domain-containing protein (c-di-GMP phosphodiesterase class II)